MTGVLDGIRVASLAQQYPGPYCTMLLADLGADVVLIEQPGRGDPARGATGSEAMSPFFAALNRGKRSIVLDLKSDAGRAACWRLIERSDVLVEGFRPGVMERLGFGPEAVREHVPSIVYCSISGYGQDGPYRLRAGHDLSYQALAGLVMASHADDPTEYRSPVAIGDLSSAMFAAFGIVAALLRRERTGEGETIDVSMTDGLVSWMGTALEPVLNGGARRRGSREPAYGVFRCGDGRSLTLSIAHEDHFWRNLCAALGMPELAALRSGERRDRSTELHSEIERRLATRPRDEWVVALEAQNVPVGPVLDLDEVVRDPHLVARRIFVEGPAEGGGRRFHVAHPLRFRGAPARPPAAAPALGEHTEQILAELGLPASEIAALQEAGR